MNVALEVSNGKPIESPTRTRPPITAMCWMFLGALRLLALRCYWKSGQTNKLVQNMEGIIEYGGNNSNDVWVLLEGSSTKNSDGRSGKLMSIVMTLI